MLTIPLDIGGKTPIPVSGSLTAKLDGYYVCVANATFSDPAPQEGRGFVVFVRNGTATLSGGTYTEGALVFRYFHSGSWQEYQFIHQGLVRTGSFTAARFRKYVVTATATVTDPAGVAAGDFYEVIVGGGTCTIGGVPYAASRMTLVRFYNGSSWSTLTPTLSDNLVLNGTNNTAPNQTAADATSLMTRGLSDVRYGNAAILRLTSDFTINNTAVESVVTGWSASDMALAANSTYIIEVSAVIAATAGGWRIQAYGDSGGGQSNILSAYWNANAATPSWIADSRNSSNIAAAFASSGTIGGANIRYNVRTGSFPGSFELRFRQNTADASNTSIKAGSFAIVRKLQ